MTSPTEYPPHTDSSEPSELFHENSKQYRADARVGERIMAMSANPLLQRIAASHKSYRSALRVRLPELLPSAKLGFDDTILARRSARDFSIKSLTLLETAKLAYFANGISGSATTHDGRTQLFRTTPSGGALYPTELYVVALNVEELTSGVYHHNPTEGCLEQVCPGNNSSALRELTFTEEIEHAAAVFAITGIPLKARIKYGERGYRFMLMEAGHMAQNILLTAAAIGLSAIPVGGFIDDELDQLLRIDGIDELSLYLVAVGRKKQERDGL
jgi:SagB-type dehydrogenase family enzyme